MKLKRALSIRNCQKQRFNCTEKLHSMIYRAQISGLVGNLTQKVEGCSSRRERAKGAERSVVTRADPPLPTSLHAEIVSQVSHHQGGCLGLAKASHNPWSKKKRTPAHAYSRDVQHDIFDLLLQKPFVNSVFIWGALRRTSIQ